MKKVLVIVYYLSFLSAVNLLAQNVGIGTNTPDASAKLDIVDANRGLLIPRVALGGTNASSPVTSPATSLLVYNTAIAGDVWPGFYYWNGTKWVRLDTGNGDWKLDGNNNGVLRTIGTKDNFDFPIETNGIERMRVTTAGNVGIGTAAPGAKLDVAGRVALSGLESPGYGGASAGVAILGTPNSGGGLLFRPAGLNSASGEVLFRSDASYFSGNVGIGTTGPWAKLAIEQSGGNSGIGIHRPGVSAGGVAAGLQNTAGISLFSNWWGGFSGEPIRFGWAPWNGDWNNFTEVMRIHTNGNVGIGTTTPVAKLAIQGDVGIGRNDVDNAQGWARTLTLTGGPHAKLLVTETTAGVKTGIFSHSTWWAGGVGKIGTESSHPLALMAGYGNDVMTLTTSGNVGIGTTTPGADVGMTGGLTINGTNLTQLTVQKNGTSGFAMNVGQNIAGDVNMYDKVGGTWNHGITLRGGNVGIGTSNPAAKLHIRLTSTPPTPQLLLEQSSADGARLSFINNSGSSNYWTLFGQPNATAANALFNLYYSGFGNIMSLRGNGNVGIVTVTPRTRLDVPSRNSGIAGNGTSQDGPTNAIIEAGQFSIRLNDWPNTWYGGLSTWDIVGASAYLYGVVTRSDRAYKTNISPIEADPNFVQKFMQLNPVTYNFNRKTIPANEWDYQRLHYGFIANEVEKLFPDIVVNAGLDPSIKRGLEYDAFIPMLVKIVQNQQKTIENLQQENTSLKSELQELKNELDHLKAYVGLKSQK